MKLEPLLVNRVIKSSFVIVTYILHYASLE